MIYWWSNKYFVNNAYSFSWDFRWSKKEWVSDFTDTARRKLKRLNYQFLFILTEGHQLYVRILLKQGRDNILVFKKQHQVFIAVTFSPDLDTLGYVTGVELRVGAGLLRPQAPGDPHLWLVSGQWIPASHWSIYVWPTSWRYWVLASFTMYMSCPDIIGCKVDWSLIVVGF